MPLFPKLALRSAWVQFFNVSASNGDSHVNSDAERFSDMESVIQKKVYQFLIVGSDRHRKTDCPLLT
ncbi:hypothetical protein ACTXT7_012629 [Hymenolepis weldensis]